LPLDLQAQSSRCTVQLSVNDQIVERVAGGGLLARYTHDVARQSRRSILVQKRREVVSNDGVFVGEALAAGQFGRSLIVQCDFSSRVFFSSTGDELAHAASLMRSTLHLLLHKSGANLGIASCLFEELLVHLLDLKDLLDPTANVIADHQPGELVAVDQDDPLAEELGGLPSRGRER
jgi:hypothetical protein